MRFGEDRPRRPAVPGCGPAATVASVDPAPACDSCGDVVDDLVVVRRIYVTWDLDQRPSGEHLVADTEVWCAVCRTQYPHQVAGAGEPPSS